MKTILAFLLVLVTVVSSSAQVINNMPKPVGLVNDFEDIFTPEQEQTLSVLLLEAQLPADAKIAVVTISKDSTPKEEFEAFTLQLAKSWGIGDANEDNGILIAVSAGYRRIRIQNGNGIVMRMSDAETKAIIDDFIIPKFKENDYYQGIADGISQIVKHLKENK